MCKCRKNNNLREILINNIETFIYSLTYTIGIGGNIMTIADVFKESCQFCHSVGYRVEYEKHGGRWVKKTICCNCRQDLQR